MKRILMNVVVLVVIVMSTTGFAPSAGSGILHGFVKDSTGAPVTDLTAVVTHLGGQFPFSGSQGLSSGGEFVLQPTVGNYLIELVNDAGEVVDYRTGINIFNNITTFQFFELDQPTLCQTNLGFGQAGGMTLTVCGDDLTLAGSLATLSVYNATPSSLVFAPVGLVNSPIPLMGGTLVPFPWLNLFPLSSDTGGRVELSIPGAAGVQVKAYIQVVDTNGASFRFSNAVEVDIGL